MLATNPNEQSDHVAQLRKPVEIEASTAPTIYLVLTDRARQNIVDLGFIPAVSYQVAERWLIDELASDNHRPVMARLTGAKEVVLLGDNARTKCIISDAPPSLVINNIQTPWGPGTEAQRHGSIEVRVKWLPVAS